MTKIEKNCVKLRVLAPNLNMAQAVLQHHCNIEENVKKSGKMVVKCKLAFTNFLLNQSTELFRKR